MLIINVRYKTKPDMRQDFYNGIMNSGIAETSREENGNHRYEYTFPKNEPDILELKEEWEDADSQRAHTQTENFRKLGKLKDAFVLDTELNMLTCRKAVISDMPRVYEIELESFPPAEAATLEKYQWRFAHYPDYFFVGEADGKITTVVEIIPTAEKTVKDDIFEMLELPNGKNAAILSVMTASDYRTRGMAGMLLSYAIDKMKDAGMTDACLTCKNHLIHYYGSFGFKNAGISESVHGGAVWYDMVRKL